MEKSTAKARPDVSEDHPNKRILLFHLKTLFLFTSNDFKTVVIPQCVFAMSCALSMAPLITSGPLGLVALARRIPHIISWIWLNLLVENMSNQRLADSVLEDQNNKPWRPVPSERMTAEEARTWLLAAIPLTLALSAIMDALMPSLALMVCVWMYNDLEGSSGNIWLRNTLKAGGLMCFSWGALCVTSGDTLDATRGLGGLDDVDEISLTTAAYSWIALTGAIIMTTVHAQDMPDIEGDLTRGRRTIPLLYGERGARWSLAGMMISWSGVCLWFWGFSGLWVSFFILGFVDLAAILSILQLGKHVDEVVWKIWCGWMICLYFLPLFPGKAEAM